MLLATIIIFLSNCNNEDSDSLNFPSKYVLSGSEIKLESRFLILEDGTFEKKDNYFSTNLSLAKSIYLDDFYQKYIDFIGVELHEFNFLSNSKVEFIFKESSGDTNTGNSACTIDENGTVTIEKLPLKAKISNEEFKLTYPIVLFYGPQIPYLTIDQPDCICSTDEELLQTYLQDYASPLDSVAVYLIDMIYEKQ